MTRMTTLVERLKQNSWKKKTWTRSSCALSVRMMLSLVAFALVTIGLAPFCLMVVGLVALDFVVLGLLPTGLTVLDTKGIY